MACKNTLMLVSLGAHCAAIMALGGMEVSRRVASERIELFDAPPPDVEPSTPPPPVAAPLPAQRPQPARSVSPEPKAEPEAEPGADAMDAIPDFGLTLSGGSEGGIAVAVRPRVLPPAPVPRPVTRTLTRVREATSGLAVCRELPTKPRPRSVPQPVYSEPARSAGVGGRVRLQLTVDERGAVADVRVIEGVGHGLDEAALAAARRASFEPATRCGKPAQGTFTLSVRFTAS